jgi:UDP-galactose transporter B1
MILGVLLGKKSYPFRKYIFVLLIVVGVVLFMFKDKGKSTQDVTFGLGELLLILSLIMDGLTGGVQERIRAEAKPSGQQMMKASNGWSTLFLGVALIVTGEGFKFFEFAHRQPTIIGNLLVLGMTQAIGQMFLYNMVSDFGPLVVSVVTTTRKFFTVLGSVIIFGNALSLLQWIGATLVFSGLFFDAFFSKGTAKKSPSNKS